MVNSSAHVILCLIVLIVCVSMCFGSPTLVTPATENYLDHNNVIEYLSQSGPDGKKPSKLRLLLLNDLRKVAYEHEDTSLSQEIDSNCVAVATFEVRTRNCKCETHKCSASQSNTTAKATITASWKGSRHLQRNCDSVCCQQPQLTAYSNTKVITRRGTENCPDLQKQFVKITKVNAAHQVNIDCVGRLISPSVVLTAMDCVEISPDLNELRIIRESETESPETRRVIKRLIPDNFSQTFEDVGLNIALILLDQPFNGNATDSNCLLPISSEFSDFTDCFVASSILSNKSPMSLFSNEKCNALYNSKFYEKAHFCAGRTNGKLIENLPHGAPLICKIGNDKSSQILAQVGMLSLSTKYEERTPYMFTDMRFSKKLIFNMLKDV